MKKFIILSGLVMIIQTASYSQGLYFSDTADAKSVVISLDKMNVLYLGVYNPITIGNSDQSFDNTVVTATNALIEGEGAHRRVKPLENGPVKITVAPKDAKAVSFPFRVKRIPDPVFKIGSGKVRMPAIEFKMQQFCRADVENFDFDLDFDVIEATVYFTGFGFDVPMSSYIINNSLDNIRDLMNLCKPGSVVTFDNIKVKGPDGVRTIEGKSIYLY